MFLGRLLVVKAHAAVKAVATLPVERETILAAGAVNRSRNRLLEFHWPPIQALLLKHSPLFDGKALAYYLVL